MSLINGKNIQRKYTRVYFGYKVFEIVDGEEVSIMGCKRPYPKEEWVNEWSYRNYAHRMEDDRFFGFHAFRFRHGALNWMRFMFDISPNSAFVIRKVKIRGVFKKGKVYVSADGCKVARVIVAKEMKVVGGY